MSAPAPFLVSVSDSIRILLDERRVQDAVEFILVCLTDSSFPHSSTLRELLRLSISDASVGHAEATAVCLLFRRLLADFGTAPFAGVWVPSSYVPGATAQMYRILPLTLAEQQQQQQNQSANQLSTFWSTVQAADKQRMHMQLLMAIARQDLAQAGWLSGSVLVDSPSAHNRRRGGAPAQVAEALDMLAAIAAVRVQPDAADEVAAIAAQWLDVIGSADCPLEVADFYDIVSDRAVEVINIMAQAGVSPNDRSEESSSSGADSDDRDDGSGGDDKVRDSGDCEDMAVAVDDDGQDSDDTRTDSKGRPTPKRARRSQPNPKDREKQRRSADTHKQRLLSIFVRTLGAGEMLRRLCDRALVASSVYPPSVRHLVRLPPHWGKVSKLHLDSRPVHMTPNNLWLHGVLIAGMLRGLELSDEERAEAKAQIARLVDEWRSELSDAQPRNRRERQSPGRGGRGGKRGPASGGAGNRRSSRGSRTSLDRGDLRSGAATSESEGDDDALGSREDVLSRDWEAGLRILAASM